MSFSKSWNFRLAKVAPAISAFWKTRRNKSSLLFSCYIGEGSRSWSSRKAEHDPGRASNSDSKSAIKQHATQGRTDLQTRCDELPQEAFHRVVELSFNWRVPPSTRGDLSLALTCPWFKIIQRQKTGCSTSHNEPLRLLLWWKLVTETPKNRTKLRKPLWNLGTLN